MSRSGQKWPSANVGKTSWASMPSASRTRERTSVSSAPGAIQPFGPFRTSGPISWSRCESHTPGSFAISSAAPAPGPEQPEWLEAGPHRLVGELAEPVGRLHQVAVGVENRCIHWAPRRCQVVRPA